MSSDILDKVNQQLTAEQWTRIPISEFTIEEFKVFDSLLQEIFDQSKQNEAKEVCEYFVEQNKNSVIGLYLCGMISLRRQQIDDAYILSLIDLFHKQKRWGLCEHICNSALRFGENSVILKILAECLERQHREEEVYQVWGRLVKVDYQETSILLKLAQYWEEKGETAAALDFYQKAVNRHLAKRKLKPIAEAWQALIRLDLNHIELFQQIFRKMVQIHQIEAVEYLEELYEKYLENGDQDQIITVLKWILEYDANDIRIRKALVQAYREKYRDHSHLEDYIKLANLEQSWRNVNDAVSDFEKHISYDIGNFVYHKNWGVGRIRSIEREKLVIDFSRKRQHVFSMRMATDALQSLPQNHIWVLKSAVTKEKLYKRIKKDIPWALRNIIQSFDNRTDMKKIKNELVPQILSEGEWSTWSKEARKILKTDPSFGVHPEKPAVFILREKPMSHGEKLANSFSGETDCFKRMAIAQEYLENNDADTDYFLEMFRYFTSNLKAQNINEQYIASYLYIKLLQKQYPFLSVDVALPTFRELYQQIEKPGDIYAKINNTGIQEEFVLQVKSETDNWPYEISKLFPAAPGRIILQLLIENGKEEQLQQLATNIINRFKEFRNAFVWLVQNVLREPWFWEHREKVIVAMLRLFDLCARDVMNKKDLIENRKYLRILHKVLVKGGELQHFIESCSENTASRIYELLKEINRMDKEIIKIEWNWFLSVYEMISTRFPKLRLQELEKEQRNLPELINSSGQFILVTEKSLQERREKLRNILEVEIPQNSKEIGEAIEFGDLKENAEYKAGKEKQENLNIQVGKLRSAIEKAKVFDPKDIDTKQIGFGTVVTLRNLLQDKLETFTILGPWESDPENGIISYLSPLGSAVLGAKNNQEIEFEINERKLHYLVEEITSAQF